MKNKQTIYQRVCKEYDRRLHKMVSKIEGAWGNRIGYGEYVAGLYDKMVTLLEFKKVAPVDQYNDALVIFIENEIDV